jgi:hypothetical protein
MKRVANQALIGHKFTTPLITQTTLDQRKFLAVVAEKLARNKSYRHFCSDWNWSEIISFAELEMKDVIHFCTGRLAEILTFCDKLGTSGST